jgi:alkylated DNA nucleotide flippase Atl1
MALFPDRKPLTHKAAMTTFSDRVVKLALSIPPGKVSTYGAIAKAAGGGGMAARSVTGILAKAWENGEKNIPFHRIVYSNGNIWVVPEFEKRRMALYKKEGIKIDKNKRIVDFADTLYEF